MVYVLCFSLCVYVYVFVSVLGKCRLDEVISVFQSRFKIMSNEIVLGLVNYGVSSVTLFVS